MPQRLKAYLIKPDKAPRTWFDLCKPEFKGQVSFDPAETRFLAGLYVMMGEGKVKEWLKCMGQNQPIIQQGHTQRMELMLTGDSLDVEEALVERYSITSPVPPPDAVR